MFQISVHSVDSPELRSLSFKVRALVCVAFQLHLVNNLSSQCDKLKKGKYRPEKSEFTGSFPSPH